MLNGASTDARRAFTLLEVVVAVAILAVLAAAVLSVALGRLSQGRSAAVAQTLASLSAGVIEYRADVRRYPTNLRHLSTVPAYGVKDLCNQTVPAAFLSTWRGPYLKSVFAPSGLVIQDMTVSDTLELIAAGIYSVTSSGLLVIVTRDVDTEVANDLEERFDGDANLAAGTIRFTPTASGKGTLRFTIPVRGC